MPSTEMGNEKKLIWDADDYNKSNGSQFRDAKETIDMIIKNGDNKADSIIVDIGCGSGNVTKLLSSCLSPKKIFASDFDAQMIGYAKENAKDEKIEYFVQDISLPWDKLDERLKNLEGKVDVVWSNRVLHWIPDKAKATAAKTIARLLKPGGRCYINITLVRDYNDYVSEADKKEQQKYFDFIPQKVQLENWNSYFKNSGLSDVKIDFLEKHWMYNVDQRKQMFQSCEPHLRMVVSQKFKELSEEEQKTLMKVMVEKVNYFTEKPYGKNSNAILDNDTKNEIKLYYEQFRVVGVK